MLRQGLESVLIGCKRVHVNARPIVVKVDLIKFRFDALSLMHTLPWLFEYIMYC